MSLASKNLRLCTTFRPACATLGRARFSTARPLRSDANTSPLQPSKQKSKTGTLPPYGPVGVAAALDHVAGDALEEDLDDLNDETFGGSEEVGSYCIDVLSRFCV